MDAAGDRLFDERLVDLGLQPDEVAAFLVGENVAAIADSRCRAKIQAFFGRVNEGDLDLVAVTSETRKETTRRLWGMLEQGTAAERNDV